MAAIKGKWKWKETFSLDELPQASYEIEESLQFESNNQTFNRLGIFTSPTNSTPVGIRYDNQEVRSLDVHWTDPENYDTYYTEAEFNEEYRIMDFGNTEQTVDNEEIYNFIITNAYPYDIAGKLELIAKNEQKVYDAGKQAEYDAFWDTYQENGNRTNYQFAFAGIGWTDDAFKPKYSMILAVGYTGNSLFWGNYATDIAAVLEKRGLKLDTTLCGYMGSMFQNSKTVRIPELNCTRAMDYSSNGLLNTFNNSEVETIDKLIVPEGLKYSNTFNSCANLKNIVFEGVIGNDINFQWCPLSVDSMKSIISCLKYLENDEVFTKSITFNDACWKALEESGDAPNGSASWKDYVAYLGWNT